MVLKNDTTTEEIVCRQSEGIPPPFCCQEPMTDELWAERTARLQAAGERARATFPTACPRCGHTWSERGKEGA